MSFIETGAINCLGLHNVWKLKDFFLVKSNKFKNQELSKSRTNFLVDKWFPHRTLSKVCFYQKYYTLCNFCTLFWQSSKEKHLSKCLFNDVNLLFFYFLLLRWNGKWNSLLMMLLQLISLENSLFFKVLMCF